MTTGLFWHTRATPREPDSARIYTMPSAPALVTAPRLTVCLSESELFIRFRRGVSPWGFAVDGDEERRVARSIGVQPTEAETGRKFDGRTKQSASTTDIQRIVAGGVKHRSDHVERRGVAASRDRRRVACGLIRRLRCGRRCENSRTWRLVRAVRDRRRAT